MPVSDRRLLASIHDVSPRFESQIDRLVDRLTGLLGGPRFAMLVVPDHWGTAPIARNRDFQARLRDWSASGVEMFVHGWFHRDDSHHAAAAAGFKARHMTAGEGEFLGLDHATALDRMCRGRALIEDIIGTGVAGFVAPAWLYGRSALLALNEAGFAIAEDHLKIWSPAGGGVLARGPVITWASRSRARIASSLAFASLARHVLAPTRTVRVAVHPGDVTVPALLNSIDATVKRLAHDRVPARYRDLLTTEKIAR